MYAVEVAPLTRGVLKGSLTFFSKEPAEVGSIVEAPVRNRVVRALVLSSRDVREQKLDIKASGFSLKKLEASATQSFFTPKFMEAASRAADYFVAPLGAVIAHLSFASLLSQRAALLPARSARLDADGVKLHVQALQAEFLDRVHAYRNVVRECFARGRSVIIIAPTLIEEEVLKRELARGIEERVVSISSTKTQRALRTLWNKVAGAPEALLLIGTPPALSFPLSNVDAIIVERESARSYVTRSRPLIDTRRVAEFYAEQIGARFILADFPLRVETLARTLEGTADDLARPISRSASSARVSLVDTRTKDEVRGTRRHFVPIQPSTVDAIERTLVEGGRVAVFAARRGIAPLTVCNDCGTPVTDPATGVPMVLHKTPKGNMFVSHRSGAIISAERSCEHCGGWNLVTLGIGVDRVYDEIRKRVPKSKVVAVTKETTPTHAAAKKLMAAFYKGSGGVVVGTERMLPYLTEPVTLTVVASIDSLLSLPAWRAGVHALHILYGLLARTAKEYIIETRKPDAAVIKSLVSLSPMEYLREEVRERRLYGYPPFNVFIGLSWSGSESAVQALAERVRSQFSDYDLVGPLPPETEDRSRLVQRAVIRVNPREWPNARLAELIGELGPSIIVSVDPDDIV